MGVINVIRKGEIIFSSFLTFIYDIRMQKIVTKRKVKINCHTEGELSLLLELTFSEDIEN